MHCGMYSQYSEPVTVSHGVESEIEQRLWASASWVITTRASFFGFLGAGDLAWLEG